MFDKPERKQGHHIAFTPSLWAAIAAEAARQNRSVQNWLAVVAAKALEESSVGNR